LGLEIRLDGQRLVQGSGDGLARDVVLGGSEAAGGQRQVGAVPGAAKDIYQAVQVVTHLGRPVQVDAQRRQAGSQVVGVGVQELAQQDLGADGDDFGF
jgi:hypothetical protein